MKKKTAIISILAFIVFGLFVYYWYQGSCLKSHSKTFNQLGKPMIKTVLAFYKENQRYPNLKESKVLFEKLGCINIRQKEYRETKNKRGEIYKKWASYDCEYKSRPYHFGLFVTDLSIEHEVLVAAYEISFNKGNTRCFTSFNKNGTVGREYLSCHQDSCINLSH